MKGNDNGYKMRSFTFIKAGLVFGILIILSSCLSMRPGGVKSGKKLYATFFVGEDGTQYFIKPLTFSAAQNEEMKLDITFRHKNEIRDSAIVNMSFLSKENFKNADSLRIINDSVSIFVDEIKYMFSERDKKIYNCRFSAKVNMIDIDKLFEDNNWNLILYKNGGSTTYTTPKSTKKKIDKLNYNIFDLF